MDYSGLPCKNTDRLAIPKMHLSEKIEFRFQMKILSALLQKKGNNTAKIK